MTRTNAQIVPLPRLEIIWIVRRSYFHNPRPELRIDESIGDHRNLTAYNRQPHAAADQMLVPLVVRMHCDGGIAQHGFGPSGGKYHAFFTAHDGIADVPQVTGNGLMDGLDVRDRSVAIGTPVDHIVAAINKTCFP